MKSEETAEHLVERIRAHDRRAMSLLYHQYVEQLSSVCYRYVPSESDAKDVLQNSFVKIFTTLPTFEYRSDEAFKGWMAKVVVNEALTFLKKRQRLLFVDVPEAKMQLMADDDEEPAVEHVSPDQLHQLIADLPSGYRTVLNLYAFEGCSHKRIAELLGIKENTSASQLFHAKKLLAKRIKELMKGK